jgi:hypothetical protein
VRESSLGLLLVAALDVFNGLNGVGVDKPRVTLGPVQHDGLNERFPECLGELHWLAVLSGFLRGQINTLLDGNPPDPWFELNPGRTGPEDSGQVRNSYLVGFIGF